MSRRYPNENENIRKLEIEQIANIGVACEFKSCPPLVIDWRQFHNFLLQRMTAKTADDRYRYSKQFHTVLQNGDASTLMQLPPNKRIHIMKSLSSLAKFTGCSDTWHEIVQRYQLSWSTGTEKIVLLLGSLMAASR